MRNIFLLIVSLFALYIIPNAQNHNHYNFGNPLEIRPLYAANFGELRTNHFHMGLDFKTKGIEGLNILSVEDGYVSRIKVSSYGYGKVIYIDHPNGITSVYAHCSKFLGKIDSIINLEQYKQKSFEVEIFPEPNSITVKKGQKIALSGNTGGSMAPHLHFELRDTKTETALNPLLYGYDITDHKRPKINSLKIYALDKNGFIIDSKSVQIPILSNGQNYYTKNFTLPENFIPLNGGIGVGVNMFDQYDSAHNKIGVFKHYLILDNDTISKIQIDSVSFDNTRYINCYSDYKDFKTLHRKYHKSFKNKITPLGIYKMNNLGALFPRESDTLDLSFFAEDTKSNKTKCKINLIVNDQSFNKERLNIDADIISPFYNYTFNEDNIRIDIENYTFYQPEICTLVKNGDFKFEFGSEFIPIHHPIKIKVKDSSLISDSRKYLTVNNKYLKTIIKDDTLCARSKYLGRFEVKSDINKPYVSNSNFNTSKSITQKSIKWKIYDRESGLKSYNLFIDDQWFLAEYEYKTNALIFNIPKKIKGYKNVKVIVKDNCNNQTEWSANLNFQ